MQTFRAGELQVTMNEKFQELRGNHEDVTRRAYEAFKSDSGMVVDQALNGECQEITGSSFCTDDSSQPLQSCISTSESHTDALSDGLSAVKGWRPSLQTSADS